MDNYNSFIELIDEQGEKERFEYLDTIEYEGMKYVALTPYFEDEDDSEELEVVILRIEHVDEDEDTFVVEDDDDKREAVFNIFRENFEEMEDEEEDDE